MSRTGRVLSIDKRTKDLLYMNMPLTADNIKEIESVRNTQVIPKNNARYFYESLIYSISNQRIQYESALKFMKLLHNLPDEQIKDADIVYKIAREGPLKWHYKSRFKDAFKFMEQRGGIENVVRDYLRNPFETRDVLRKEVKFIGLKTATLWYMCLGGKDPLICLDIHITRQLASLGGEIRESSYISQEIVHRSRKRREIRGLQGKEYLEAEKQVINIIKELRLVKKYRNSFFNGNGNLDGSMINSLLWWIGAKSFRNKSLNQFEFFPTSQFKEFISPYTSAENGKTR